MGHDGVATAGTSRKTLAIFVHGFKTDERCWDPLLKTLAQNESIRSRFCLHRFGYETGLVSLDPRKRLPDLDEVAGLLDTFIQNEYKPSLHRDFVLIGHSMGGLVVQKYLLRKVDTQWRDLEELRQVILIATPNRGSVIAQGIREVLFSLAPNEQEDRLRVLDKDIGEMSRSIEQKILNATEARKGQFPISIHAFWGTEDNVVPEISAKGSFECSEGMAGDHHSILLPASPANPRRPRIDEVLPQALLQPAGHRHVYELESFSVSVIVQPQAATPRTFTWGLENAYQRTVTTDNVADIVRSVKFLRQNNCRDEFELSYKTRDENYLTATMEVDPPPSESVVNQARPDYVGAGEISGTEAVFGFEPEPGFGYNYTYTVKVWGGFGAGNRDVHFHHWQKMRCATYIFVVDLSAYIRAGWTIEPAPRVFRYTGDPGEQKIRHTICAKLSNLTPETLTSYDPRGIWRWEIPDFRGGVVGTLWDAAPPVTP